MLARLILALLLAVFAMPGVAPAACHDAVQANAARTSHAMPMPASTPDDRAAPVHACIGCVPPSDWLSPRVTSPALLPAAAPVAAPPARLSSIAPPPSTPPPRRG